MFLSHNQFQTIKQIVFIGDSITYDGRYISYLEAHLKIAYPELQTEFINLGLLSETASGLSEDDHARGQFRRPCIHERLSRMLDKLKPDWIFSNYGINDGIYLPFDKYRFERYQQGIQRLHEYVTSKGVHLIHVTPPIFDSIRDESYAKVVHKHADWLLSKVKSDNWQVIDTHWPMQNYLNEARNINLQARLSKDGIHPNSTGHKLIAEQLLNWLGIKDTFAFEVCPSGEKILQLITKRQRFVRNAWLTEIGHCRPNVEAGMALDKTLLKCQIINQKLTKLLS